MMMSGRKEADAKKVRRDENAESGCYLGCVESVGVVHGGSATSCSPLVLFRFAGFRIDEPIFLIEKKKQEMLL